MNAKHWLGAVAGFLILAGAGCSFSFGDAPTKRRAVEPTPAPVAETQPGVVPVTTPSTATPAVVVKPEFTNCKTIDCLVGLAKDCEKGDLTYSFTMPLPMGEGLMVNSKTYYKINGKSNGGLCSFTTQSRGGTVFIPEADKQAAIAAGTSEEQITKVITGINSSINDSATLKIITSCSGANANVATYMAGIKDGKSESSCSTSLSAGGGTTCTFEPNISCTIQF